MHCKPLGQGTYVLDNSPFYAYDVSLEDTIAASMQDGCLVFERVVRRGGHSTYRVRLPEGESHDAFLKHWSPQEHLGCTYEGTGVHPRRLYAIDVPPGVSVRNVYDLLEQGEHEGWWEFEEGHCFSPEYVQ